MTTLAQASSFNVEATLNTWMSAALAAFTRPAWLPTLPAIVYDAPEISASLPCFSLIHIPVSTVGGIQGRWAGSSTGMKALGILDVSCWVSRSASVDWNMQLRTMRDMVLSSAVKSAVLVIGDYAALPTNTVAPAITTTALLAVQIAGDDGTWSDTATATAYKINIGDAALTPTEPDPNPDVMRVRVLIDYDYYYRVN